MTTVATEQLLVVTAHDGAAALAYTCPAGVRTVVTDMRISYGVNLLPGDMYYLHQPSGAKVFAISYDNTDGLNTVQMTGRLVLNPGDELWVVTDEGYTADFFASGFTLTLP